MVEEAKQDGEKKRNQMLMPHNTDKAKISKNVLIYE